MDQKMDGGISRVKLALGALSLFLFLVGLKRTFRRADGSEVLSNGEVSKTDDAPTPLKVDEPHELQPLRDAS